MDHPFFKNIRIFFYYLAIWLLVICIHVASLSAYSHMNLLVSTIDSLVFNSIYAILGLPVWYIVRFSDPVKSNIPNLIINHITTLSIIILLWTGLGMVIMIAFFPSDNVYLSFLSQSLPWRIISGIFYYSILVLIYYINIYYSNLQERLNKEKQLVEMVKQAELDALKSQINPHFLFNSLNSISSLTLTNPGKAQDMIIKLSEFLRYSVSQSTDYLTPLKKELENIRRYLDIEQVRFGSRLIYRYEVPVECNELKIPVMILQPLFENAVKHGVYESTEPITISTLCEYRDDILIVEIMNNFDPEARKKKGAGIGLKNIRDRLKLIYGNEQLLKTSSEGDIFSVKVYVPQN